MSDKPRNTPTPKPSQPPTRPGQANDGWTKNDRGGPNTISESRPIPPPPPPREK